MSKTKAPLERRLQELREGFDSSFAHPVDLSRTARTSMALCCRLGSQRYALPISEVSGVFELRSVLAIPARAKGFLGIGMFRSAMIPVYDLGSFLGTAAAGLQGWSVLLGHANPVGVKIDAVEGYAAFGGKNLSLNRSQESMRYLQGRIEHGGNSYALIDARQLHNDIVQREE